LISIAPRALIFIMDRDSVFTATRDMNIILDRFPDFNSDRVLIFITSRALNFILDRVFVFTASRALNFILDCVLFFIAYRALILNLDRVLLFIASRALNFILDRSEEHTSELQSHSSISYAVFCLKNFFFNDTATTEIYTNPYTLSLHDALPISRPIPDRSAASGVAEERPQFPSCLPDRKSTRLNSSHTVRSRMPSSA
jgi:hypothetical protein